MGNVIPLLDDVRAASADVGDVHLTVPTVERPMVSALSAMQNQREGAINVRVAEEGEGEKWPELRKEST